jgi:hypothetical protein
MPAIVHLTRQVFMFKEPCACRSPYLYTCRQFIPGRAIFFAYFMNIPETGITSTGKITGDNHPALIFHTAGGYIR